MTNTIFVSQGAKEFVNVSFTERAGLDISTTTITVSLGNYSDPIGSWRATETVVSEAPNIKNVRFLVDDSFPVGSYHVWAKLVDSEETVIMRCSDETLRLI